MLRQLAIQGCGPSKSFSSSAPASCCGLVAVSAGAKGTRLEECTIKLADQAQERVKPNCAAVLVHSGGTAALISCKISGTGRNADGVCVAGPGSAAAVNESVSHSNGANGFSVCAGGKMVVGPGCRSCDNKLSGFHAQGAGTKLTIQDSSVAERCGLRVAQASGLQAEDGASVSCGKGCSARQCCYGFAALKGATVSVGAECRAEECTTTGFASSSGSLMTVSGHCSSAKNGLAGFSSDAAVLKAGPGCAASGNERAGFSSRRGGSLTTGPGSVSSRNGGSGFSTLGPHASSIVGPESRAEDNTNSGFECTGGGTLEAQLSCHASGNGSGFFCDQAGSVLRAAANCTAIRNKSAGFYSSFGASLTTTGPCTARDEEHGCMCQGMGSQVVVAAGSLAVGCRVGGYGVMLGGHMEVGPGCTAHNCMTNFVASGPRSKLTVGDGVQATGANEDGIRVPLGEVDGGLVCGPGREQLAAAAMSFISDFMQNLTSGADQLPPDLKEWMTDNASALVQQCYKQVRTGKEGVMEMMEGG